MKRSHTWLSSLFLLSLVFLLPLRAHANGSCPPIQRSPSCSVLITINPNGSLTYQRDPSVPPYDGDEDVLVGVVNNSGATVYGVSISGPDIFGFDGDGAGPNGGYEGPGTTFAIANPNQGVVNFTGGLANGGFRWFSLEGNPSAASFARTVAIDPGHGYTCGAIGENVGAVGDVDYPASNPPAGKLHEDALTVDVAARLLPMLRSSGYRVVVTKTNPQMCVTYLERGAIAEKARANVFVSIHFNAPAKFGCSLFDYCSGTSALYNSLKSDSQTLAAKLASAVSGSIGLPNAGVEDRPGLAVLKPTVTKMTAAIIEVARLNEPDEDVIHASNGRQRAAAGIKQGLDAFLNQ